MLLDSEPTVYEVLGLWSLLAAAENGLRHSGSNDMAVHHYFGAREITQLSRAWLQAATIQRERQIKTQR